MDGVLEGAAVLCACKLACSLLFLPSLTGSQSPVSFCCCCHLLFTDFLVTVFLTILCILEPWLSDQSFHGDVIALRFLLFLSHTYGVVLLLTIPLIAVETLNRLFYPPSTVAHQSKGSGPGDDELDRNIWEETLEKEEEEGTRKKWKISQVVSYLCCLSVWAVVALNVSWRWKLEEVWTSTCLRRTNSLIRCLPNLLSPMPISVNPCWCMAFLSLLMLILSMTTNLDRPLRKTPACMGREKHRRKSVDENNGESCFQDFVLVPSEHVKSEPEAALCVDPEKTKSSCSVHRTYSWNNMEMSTSHYGDFVLIPPDFVSAGKVGQESERTKSSILLTFIAEDRVDSEHRRQWGFPCPGVNVMIGLVGVLSIFVLPLNLSVNIFLIRTIETLLELCIKSLVSSAAGTNNTTTVHNETLL
ncbi:uncharacterized protein LOC117821116 [Xyrichtys novacula]|uniref:Uncharacterized protein LOC117821116 n=1 Tax=Xyrichtys novacula TaxID=13765 RepID=A0AAV1EPP6_XYRNO|nr:uncharacterized protein LOC117821116 [Xyrichtys novacula]